jgi:hypothetical protein
MKVYCKGRVPNTLTRGKFYDVIGGWRIYYKR